MGLKASEEEMLMAAKSSELIWPEKRKGFEVRPVRDQEGVASFLKVVGGLVSKEEMEAITTFYTLAEPLITGGAQLPIQFLVGFQGGAPVAACSIYGDSGVASLFDVMVIPSRRGEGLGKLITAAGMEEAVKSGCSTVALTATNDAKYLYEKLGFNSLKLLRVYT